MDGGFGRGKRSTVVAGAAAKAGAKDEAEVQAAGVERAG